MRILSAHTCTYSDETQTAINCFVTSDDGVLNDDPFTAHCNSQYGYERDLFVALQVNNLADYHAPPCMEDML